MPTRTQQSDILSCAYASHGDTKHVLLFPEDPHECFTWRAQAFDLADRLQTPVFVMLDLDIGMNDRLCKPLHMGRHAQYDRGKVMTAEMLDAGKEFGRYKDVDGDGIPFRTYPGTHPPRAPTSPAAPRATALRGVFRGGRRTTQYNMQRLLKKFDDFAKDLVPKPVLTAGEEAGTRFGVLYYGSTSPAMDEALEELGEKGISGQRAARARLPVLRSTSRGLRRART